MYYILGTWKKASPDYFKISCHHLSKSLRESRKTWTRLLAYALIRTGDLHYVNQTHPELMALSGTLIYRQHSLVRNKNMNVLEHLA
jgi:hypothetical protein